MAAIFKTYIQVADETTQYGHIVYDGTLIHDKSTGKLWQVTQQAGVKNCLATTQKTQVNAGGEPLFIASPAYNISSLDINSWNNAVVGNADAVHKSVANEINGLTNKSTPDDADVIIGETSTGGAWTKIKLSLTNLWINYFKSKADLLYEKLTNKATDFTVINNTLYPSVEAVENEIIQSLSGNQTFFFYKTASDIGGYYKMLVDPSTGIGQNITTNNCTGVTLLSTFATEPTEPNKKFIASGFFRVFIRALKSGGDCNLFFRIYTRNTSNVETLIGESSISANLTNVLIEYRLNVFIGNATPINDTDRYVIKFYSNTLNGQPNITLTIENDYLCRVECPTSALDLTPYEKVVNKVTAFQVTPDDTHYPSEKLVKDSLDNKEPANSNIQSHISNTSNPHSVTKAQVGLTNVTDNAQVISPATNTANYVPQWDGANSKTLKNGLAVGSAASNLVQLDGSAKMPPVDGSQLTNLQRTVIFDFI